MQDNEQLKLWLDAARGGDIEAFGRIVTLLRPRVARVVARYATIEVDREDLLQEVFIKAFRTLKKYRGTGSFEGWLHKVAVGTSLDWLRAKMRRKERLESELSAEERHWLEVKLSGTSTDSPDRELDRNMAKELLYKALDELSPEDRTAITLFELEGMSVEEISGITGWSKSNVKVRCHRARGRLAKWIRERGENL